MARPRNSGYAGVANARVLAFDVTPSTFTRSLAKTHKHLWKKIRETYFADHGLTCGICRTTKNRRQDIDGHEIWDCQPGAIMLKEVLFVCKRCHAIIHLQHTRNRATKEGIAILEARYCELNGITEKDMRQDYADMLKRQSELFATYKSSRPHLHYGAYDDEALAAEGRRRGSDFEDDSDPFPDHECFMDIHRD